MSRSVSGQMLSPDCLVADPANPQDYKRYAYCNNNPLKFTDPSGWTRMSLDEFMKEAMKGAGGTWKNGEATLFESEKDAVDYLNKNNILGAYFDIILHEKLRYNGKKWYLNINGGRKAYFSIRQTAIRWMSRHNMVSYIYVEKENSEDKQEAAGQGGDGFGIANDIIGGAGVVNGLVGFDAAINSKHAYRYAQRINDRVVSAAELTATNQAKALKLLNVSKSIGNKLGVAGGLVIAGDVLYNSEVKASHGINAVMTGIAFTGWGAPVAGIWFVADFGTGLITGKSISNRIDSGVGAPLEDWDW